MPKIKQPMDVLVRTNAIRLLWKFHQVSLGKKDISGYRIGRDLGMDNNLT